MKPKSKSILLGVGFDHKDGHKRITRGPNFELIGGSEETHEKMAEVSIKFNEKLSKKGKSLDQIDSKEFVDLLSESGGLS